MSTWNESGRVWEEDHGLLDDRASRAMRPRRRRRSPSASPCPHAHDFERRIHAGAANRTNRSSVEARIEELADEASRKLGISRRTFLGSSGGMAATLLAMNEVFGRFFNVSLLEMFEPAAYAPAAPPRTCSSSTTNCISCAGANPPRLVCAPLPKGPSSAPTRQVESVQSAQGNSDESGQAWGVWNPALVGLPIDAGYAHITQFIKDVYLDSQVTIGLLSNVTASLVQIEGVTSPELRGMRGGAARRDSDRRADRGRAQLRQ